MGPEELGRPGWGHEGMIGDMLVPLLGMGIPLLFLAGVALVTILLLRQAKHAAPSAGYPTAPPVQTPDPALTILRERYARGELTTAEYEERRQRLLDGHEPL